MRDPLDTAGNEADAEATRKAADEARRQEVEDIKWLMGHKQGRRIAWRLLSEAGVYRTTFTGNSTGFMLEGKRAIGLFLLAEINDHCLDQFVLMLKEQKQA
jgi:hypothetical protein